MLSCNSDCILYVQIKEIKLHQQKLYSNNIVIEYTIINIFVVKLIISTNNCNLKWGLRDY